jgi:membrane-associated protein
VDLTAFMTQLLGFATSPVVLIIVVLCCVVDGVLPVLPSETLVVALAALTAAGAGPALPALLAAAAIGAIIGDCLAFAIGRRVGVDRLGWMRRPRVQRILQRASVTLRARPVPLILLARYVPVGRVAVNTAAGASGLRLQRFVAIEIASGALWACYSVGLGLIGGQWAGQNPVLAAGIAVGIAGLVTVLVEVGSRVLRSRSQVRSVTPGLSP